MPLGSFPTPLILPETLRWAGTSTEAARCSKGGFGAGFGGLQGVAVMGALPTSPSLRAAILAWMEFSAMFKRCLSFSRKYKRSRNASPKLLIIEGL